MLVHGGEGKAAFQNPHNRVSFDNNERGIDVNQSIAEESNPSAAAGIASQSTSVLLDQHDNSRELGRRPESGRGATPKATIGHDGVTLGDTLCGTKLANQVKVSVHSTSRLCLIYISPPFSTLLPFTDQQSRPARSTWYVFVQLRHGAKSSIH